MTLIAVTDNLLHQLVTGSHAEGTTHLAVAAVIEHDERALLIAEMDNDFQPVWKLPTDLVLPGETLLHALDRTVSIVTGLGITDITGYAGHHDCLIDDDIVRTFVFTVATDDPDRICRWANIGHYWTSDPITCCEMLDHLEQALTSTRPGRNIAATPLDELSAALRTSAHGLHCIEAAVELLIQQQTWLYRRDFVELFIDQDGFSAKESDCRPPMAFVDWAAALIALDTGQLLCSSGEGRLLRIAGSLAEGIPVNLRDAITGLDTVNTGLVARAICHASDHRP